MLIILNLEPGCLRLYRLESILTLLCGFIFGSKWTRRLDIPWRYPPCLHWSRGSFRRSWSIFQTSSAAVLALLRLPLPPSRLHWASSLYIDTFWRLEQSILQLRSSRDVLPELGHRYTGSYCR